MPESAIAYNGEQAYYWAHDNGHAVRTEVQTGVSDGEWIEVTNRRGPPADGAARRRKPLGADRRNGAGDRGRYVTPARRRKGGSSPGDRGGETVRRRAVFFAISDRLAKLIRPVFMFLAGLLITFTAPGCRNEAANDYTSVGEPPTVRLIKPQVRKIVRVVGQPGFIQSYERSSVYPKMNAYIDKWIVDIGDKVKKGDVLAHLFVPELVEDHETKRATVVLDRQRIALAKEVVEVAKADVKAAEARLDEAKAELSGSRAEAERWDSEVKRLQGEVDRGVVTPQDLLQSTNRWKASLAIRNAAAAGVLKADAELISRRQSSSPAAHARTGRRCGRPCRRPRSPSSPRRSAPRPASGLPSRRAATRTTGSARSCRWRRQKEEADEREHAEMRGLDRQRRRGILDRAEIERAERV